MTNPANPRATLIPNMELTRPGVRREGTRFMRASAFLIGVAACLGTANAQRSTPASQPSTVNSDGAASATVFGDRERSGSDANLARLNAALQGKRNIERQRKMVEDADKLVAMANALKTSVDKTTKDVLSIDVLKQADEVERLARSVKDKMRAE